MAGGYEEPEESKNETTAVSNTTEKGFQNNSYTIEKTEINIKVDLIIINN